MSEVREIRTNIELPARRSDIELTTEDGLTLVGELALPDKVKPVATLVTLHPLPTQGGFMDSHVLRKAAARLPALADLAVIRFNTRGTQSPRGKSQGHFDGGVGEQFDVAAAMSFVEEQALPNPWLLGWSFGTELALKYGLDFDIDGSILLSPPLHRTSDSELRRWRGTNIPLHALVPERDMFLKPEQARERFGLIPHAEIISAADAQHLWVGEPHVRWVLTKIVEIVNPDALPLSTTWPPAQAASNEP